MIEARCLVVDTLRCLVETSFLNGTAWSFCLLKTWLTGKVYSLGEVRIRFPWFRSFKKRVPDTSELLLHSIEGSWNVSDFFLSSFWPFKTQWKLKVSYSVPVMSFSGMGRFQRHFLDCFLANSVTNNNEVFLIKDDLLRTLRPSNVIPTGEQSFS